MNRLQRILLNILVLCTVLTACARKDAEAALTPAQKQAKTQLETQMAEAAGTKQTYHAMDDTALFDKLVEQSKARIESFNSPAYRELRDRERLDSKALVTLVTQNSSADGLLPLLLLRKHDMQSYREVPIDLRVKVLSESLATSKYFNEWGLPGFYQQDASRAIIESGNAAVPALKRLLSDTRQAPVFGSQEYMIYQKYQLRVCDYALYFLDEIKSKTSTQLPESPQERDALIRTAGAD